jgi:hypothetical protein
MKTKLLTTVCAALVLAATTTPSFAANEGPLASATDVLVVRPACLVATAVGSVVFVVCLPFTAASKTVKKTADTLVVKPAEATFTRPVGGLNELSGDWDY